MPVTVMRWQDSDTFLTHYAEQNSADFAKGEI
ncbi:hypothetical protein RCCS2_03072 [Roseobacter sp. CCS2]|nr:hypothetical protein RCCS2_03072 [Roseobacter sp. CCS2]